MAAIGRERAQGQARVVTKSDRGEQAGLCGIVGFTARNWSPSPERIAEATATIVHRGPDQQGVFLSRACHLGAARLKIIDLANGYQPIYSGSPGAPRDSVIVFNGEVYNHLEVRRELQALGHRFRTTCDTETVLEAFLEWDTACFERLRGMFAIAIWTESTQRLVLARDRLGIKPLYIAERRAESTAERGAAPGRDLFFASELKGILIHPEIERRLSLNGLDCYLSMNYVPSPWTLVEGIEKLPPGHWMEWQNGRTTKQAYWQAPRMQRQDGIRAISLEDAKAELDGLLASSVQEHLMSDVPLGVWLSGGVDSSSILHYAAEASSTPLRTFSIAFNGQGFDESAAIRKTVAHYGTRHEQLDLNPTQDLEAAIEQIAYYSDEPSADSGALPVWYLSKLCRDQGCTVAFSGEGADEIFGGYVTYRANQIGAQVRRFPPGLLRGALRTLRYWPTSSEKISFEYKLKRLLEGSLMPPERAHIYWNGTFSDADKAAIVRQPLPASLARLLAPLKASLPGDGVAPYLEFDQQYYLADDILVKSDRMSMAHSIEVRPPFLDHRIVEFAATLPTSLKIRGERQKYLLKQLMQPKLPPAITRRKKVGFDIPAHEWFRGPLRELLLSTLAEAEQEHSELFDFSRIRTYTQQHLSRRTNVGYHLWGLLMLFLWMKRWKIQSAPSLIASQPSKGQMLAVGL
jgi:asparagine synthase (glutamine-hydrolysing)